MLFYKKGCLKIRHVHSLESTCVLNYLVDDIHYVMEVVTCYEIVFQHQVQSFSQHITVSSVSNFISRDRTVFTNLIDHPSGLQKYEEMSLAVS